MDCSIYLRDADFKTIGFFFISEGFTERCVMNNYFSVGMDAKVALEFHLKREENPEQFRWDNIEGGCNCRRERMIAQA